MTDIYCTEPHQPQVWVPRPANRQSVNSHTIINEFFQMSPAGLSQWCGTASVHSSHHLHLWTINKDILLFRVLNVNKALEQSISGCTSINWRFTYLLSYRLWNAKRAMHCRYGGTSHLSRSCRSRSCSLSIRSCFLTSSFLSACTSVCRASTSSVASPCRLWATWDDEFRPLLATRHCRTPTPTSAEDELADDSIKCLPIVHTAAHKSSLLDPVMPLQCSGTL